MRLSWPNLSWCKANWPECTCHAHSGAYTYTVDHDGKPWTLRAWHNRIPIPFGYPTGQTAAQLQQIADDHAAAHTKP